MPAKLDSANLDFLRSNAVLAVLCFHLLLFFGVTHIGPFSIGPLGLFGVLLFFVHTCLVLMFSLARQQETFKKGSMFAVFMLRRIFRIYPLSILAVSIIAIFKLPMGHLAPGHLESVPMGISGIVSNLLLIQNITDAPSILGPLWSLPYEIQMYVFLPALFLIARKVKSVWPLAGLWAGSVVLALIHARFGHMPDLVRFIPCFVPGVIAYKAITLRSEHPKSQWKFLGWPIFLLALCAGFLMERSLDRGAVMCLLTGLAIPMFTEMRSPWLRTASHVIAKYSYGIYLFHYVCMWLAFVAFARFPLAAQWAIFLIALPSSCFVLYHVLEAPMITLGNNIAKAIFGLPRAEEQKKIVTVGGMKETARVSS